MKISSPVVMVYPGARRRASGLLRYLFLAGLLIVSLYYIRQAAQNYSGPPYVPLIPSSPSQATPVPESPTPQEPIEPEVERPATTRPTSKEPEEKEKPIFKPLPADEEKNRLQTKPSQHIHPIDDLVEIGEKQFNELLQKQSRDIEAAAAEYRKRRGRHPPPGFDRWFSFAQENDAVIVEDFFDQIYHDLGPFWGLPPAIIRKEAWNYEMTINIRDGKASSAADWFWTQIWLNLTQSIATMLPDMDIALNAMDEPRIALPWEKVNDFMAVERKTRQMPSPKHVISEFQNLPSPREGDLDTPTQRKDWQATRPFWKVASRGCHPGSLARKAEVMNGSSNAPSISLAHTGPHTYKGYVSNFTLSSDFCHQPDLQSLHGMMIEPLSTSATETLFPLFGGSKLPTNNEILLPAPMYWNNEERFSGGDDHGGKWSEKQDKVVWRGVATGGRNTATSWRGFQRHRFVAMTNSTQVSLAESWAEIPENWALPSSQYDLAAQQEGKLGDWVHEWADTGFVDLMCNFPEPNGTCNYTSPHFAIIDGMKMADQFSRKYLPDIDGNSFSGRYRGFLMSTSLPIKATIFREWHDSRLVPWKHFVPMDNRYVDFWGIMEYFVGYKEREGHDAVAEKLALDGQEWANKVLRKEDMQIYVLRLLLEYARLLDDKRDNLGWVKDLL